MSLTDLVKQQALAWASMPVSASRLLAAAADAAEAAVGVMHQMERQQAASARVLEAIEEPVVRVANAIDSAVVTQAIDAMSRLPAIVSQASAMSAQAQSVISALESPARALGPLGHKLDARRVGEIIDRIDGSLSNLGRLPEAETEVVLLRETADRLTRLMDDAQSRFSLLPGAGLLLGRGHRDAASPAAAEDGKTAQERGEAPVTAADQDGPDLEVVAGGDEPAKEPPARPRDRAKSTSGRGDKRPSGGKPAGGRAAATKSSAGARRPRPPKAGSPPAGEA